MWGAYITLLAPVDVARTVCYAAAIIPLGLIAKFAPGLFRYAPGLLNSLRAACYSISRLQFCCPKYTTMLLCCASIFIHASILRAPLPAPPASVPPERPPGPPLPVPAAPPPGFGLHLRLRPPLPAPPASAPPARRRWRARSSAA